MSLPLCDGNGTQLCYGIAEELLKLSVSCGADEPVPEEWLRAATKEERSKRRYAALFNPYVFAVLAEKLLEENGADILYGGTLSRVFKNEAGNKIEKIEVVTRTETLVFGAKTFIDCTGDAVLCDYSGEDTVHSGCVSVADDGAWDDTRVIPVCALTGEIAGVIAALYEDTEEIDIKIIIKTLSERGLKMHLNECYSLKNE